MASAKYLSPDFSAIEFGCVAEMVDDHYTADVIGGTLGLPGAGILAWLTGDQLHPPMLPDESMWSDGSKWRDGARAYVVELGGAAALRAGDHVLDIGGGVGGPARLLVDIFGVRVTSVTTSKVHAETCERLNQEHSSHARNIRAVYVQSPRDWPEGPYDVAWSLNMLYQVFDHQELYGRIADVLTPEGRFVLDDWMAGDQITENDLRAFEYHFQYRNFVRISRVEAELASAGFFPAVRLIDRGEAARGPMLRYFRREMENYFQPRLSQQWPDGDAAGISGRQMVADFVAAVEHTLKLYVEGKLTYRSLVCAKARPI